MKQIIIISDNHGYPARYAAPATAAETVIICPHDKATPGAIPIQMPESWLPLNGSDYGHRCWFRCEMMFPAAILQLGLDADFYWCAESDVCALPDVWQRLLDASAKRALDGIYVNLGPREGDTGWRQWWTHPGTPGWANKRCLGAMFRLSRRAVQWLADAAEENRETFCEVANPSTVSRAGGSTGDMKQLGWLYNGHCMRPAPHHCIVNRKLFNHPLKSNTAEPVFTHA